MSRRHRRARQFLAPQGQRGDGKGYLNQPIRELQPGDPPELVERVREATAMCDEPEAVGPAILDVYGESARFYDSLRHKAEVEAARQARKLLTTEARLVNAQRRAKMQHANLSHEFHRARKMLDRARAGNRREPPALTRTLEGIEAKLDGLPDAA